MQTIMIDGSMYQTPREMHLALKKMLSLPDYYGLNADALNDCLGEKAEIVSLHEVVVELGTKYFQFTVNITAMLSYKIRKAHVFSRRRADLRR